MLNYKSWTAAGCLFLSFAVIGCSSDKVIPQGKRVSVLEQVSTLKPDVSDGASLIKISPAEVNDEWLQSDDNAQHVIPHVRYDLAANKKWSSRFGTGSSKREILLSKPLIDKDVVYALDADGMLSAYNIKSGENIWRVELVSENSNNNDSALKGAGLAMEGKTIYVTAGFGSVVAINAKNGAKIWESNLKAPLRTAPLVAAGKVFVLSADNKFFALDDKSGEVAWDYDMAMESTTIVGGAVAAYCPGLDVVVSGFSNGDIQAFNATFGTLLWSDSAVSNRQAYSSTFLHAIKASPVIDGETVYVLGNADVLAAIDIRSGNRIWEREIGGTNTPLLSGNTLFVVSNTNDLLAIDKSNGNILWATAIELGGKATEVTPFSPILLDNKLILTLSNGKILAYNPKNGQKIALTDLDENLNSAPTVAQGYVIFTTKKAKLLAY